MAKNKIRDTDPKLADLLNNINKVFGIKAVGVKVGEEIIYRSGVFDPVRDMQVIIQQKRWGQSGKI